MALFEYNDKLGTVYVVPNLLHIKEFKKLNEHKDRDRLLSYVYHIADYTSPYAKYEDEERQKILNGDLLDNKKPTKDVVSAINKYKELNETDGSRLLSSARKAVWKLQSYFEDLDFEEETDKGKTAKDLMSNLKSVGNILSSLEEWQEYIKREQTQDQTRKGIKKTRYNE